MVYQYMFLCRNSFSDVYQTFVEAFSNYAVDMSYMKEENFFNRDMKNRIDFETSVGIYCKGSIAVV